MVRIDVLLVEVGAVVVGIDVETQGVESGIA